MNTTDRTSGWKFTAHDHSLGYDPETFCDTWTLQHPREDYVISYDGSNYFLHGPNIEQSFDYLYEAQKAAIKAMMVLK